MRRLPLLLILLVAVGCGEGGPDLSLGPTDTTVTGTFNLLTSNGNPLPVLTGVTADGDTVIDLSADQLTISADDTWTEVTSYQLVSQVDFTTTVQTATTAGIYSVASGKIDFVMTDGGTATFNGSVSGDTLSVISNSSRLVYTR